MVTGSVAGDGPAITAGGLVECTECGHVIEGHDPDCEICTDRCPATWTVAEVRSYRAEIGLPRNWR